jgi:hypothetical protein
VRAVGSFFDEAASATLVRAVYDDTFVAIPFTPTSLFRSDTMFFTTLPWQLAEKPVRGALGTSLTLMGARPLPFGESTDPFFTADATASLKWSMFELAFSCLNVLDARYRLGEFNYASDFHTFTPASAAPMRHVSAGAPRTALVTAGVLLDGPR